MCQAAVGIGHDIEPKNARVGRVSVSIDVSRRIRPSGQKIEHVSRRVGGDRLESVHRAIGVFDFVAAGDLAHQRAVPRLRSAQSIGHPPRAAFVQIGRGGVRISVHAGAQGAGPGWAEAKNLRELDH